MCAVLTGVSLRLRSRAAMDFVDGGLVGAFDEQLVDVDVRRAARHPDQSFSDVLAGERDNAVIDLFRSGLVTFESDLGKLRLGHPRVDGANPDTRAAKFQAEGAGDQQGQPGFKQVGALR